MLSSQNSLTTAFACRALWLHRPNPFYSHLSDCHHLRLHSSHDQRGHLLLPPIGSFQLCNDGGGPQKPSVPPLHAAPGEVPCQPGSQTPGGCHPCHLPPHQRGLAHPHPPDMHLSGCQGSGICAMQEHAADHDGSHLWRKPWRCVNRLGDWVGAGMSVSFGPPSGPFLQNTLMMSRNYKHVPLRQCQPQFTTSSSIATSEACSLSVSISVLL